MYQRVLDLIQDGNYETAAEEIRALRGAADREKNFLRSLLAIRVALKAGNKEVSLEQLRPFANTPTVLLAEAQFVKGLIHYHLNEFAKGLVEFENAAELYQQTGREERELLARFNVAIGIQNSDPDLPIEIALDQLRRIELRAQRGEHSRILALVFRQKSYLFRKERRFLAALTEIKRAIPLLELSAAKSDYHLGLIHAADCCLDLQLKEDASVYLDFILSPVDSRVEFPLAYVMVKLKGGTLDPKTFSTVPEHWLERYREYLGASSVAEEMDNVWNWSIGDSSLSNSRSGEMIRVRFASQEGRLISVLMKGKCTKALLCEKLWPEAGDVAIIDNRLHRLISRLNAKLAGLIQFDGSRYALSAHIQLGAEGHKTA